MSDESLNNEAVVAVPESGNTAVPDAVENNASEEQESPKTFTQEELDKIVGERLAKERRKMEREMAQAAQEQQRQAPAQAPDPSSFESAEDYAEALAEYKLDQKLAEREAQKQRNQVESTYADREEDARTKYNDFEDVAYRHPKDGGPAISEYMAEVIKGSQLGPEIAYHLGKNVEESFRIYKLDPLSQAREIGKLEASLSSSPPVAKKVSSAPEPIRPVSARAANQTLDPSDPRSTKTMSDAEWIAARNNQVAKKYRA